MIIQFAKKLITSKNKRFNKIKLTNNQTARGLDIKSIKTVINFDCARDIDSHVHRVGRTGRAGSQDGVAHTLITPKNKKFAGLLIQNLEGANQVVPSELVQLAVQDPKFKHAKTGKKLQMGGAKEKEQFEVYQQQQKALFQKHFQPQKLGVEEMKDEKNGNDENGLFFFFLGFFLLVLDIHYFNICLLPKM